VRVQLKKFAFFVVLLLYVIIIVFICHFADSLTSTKLSINSFRGCFLLKYLFVFLFCRNLIMQFVFKLVTSYNSKINK